MQDASEESFFDMRLTQESMSALQNNARMTRSLFVLGIVASLLLLGVNLLSLIRFSRLQYPHHGLAAFYDRSLHPLLSVLDIVLLIFQFYAYFRFGQVSAKAIAERDEAQLNSSFGYLVRFTRLAMVQMSLVIVLYTISVIIFIEVLTARSAG